MYVGALTGAGSIVATGGALAAAMRTTAIAGSPGCLVGTALAEIVGDRKAKYIERELESGGMLVCIKARDSKHERRARAILSNHSARDIEVHNIAI